MEPFSWLSYIVVASILMHTPLHHLHRDQIRIDNQSLQMHQERAPHYIFIIIIVFLIAGAYF